MMSGVSERARICVCVCRSDSNTNYMYYAVNETKDNGRVCGGAVMCSNVAFD